MVRETVAYVLKILIQALNRNPSGLHSGFSPSRFKYSKLELQILILEAPKLAFSQKMDLFYFLFIRSSHPQYSESNHDVRYWKK
jgi:hypothetical protein